MKKEGLPLGLDRSESEQGWWSLNLGLSRRKAKVIPIIESHRRRNILPKAITLCVEDPLPTVFQSRGEPGTILNFSLELSLVPACIAENEPERTIRVLTKLGKRFLLLLTKIPSPASSVSSPVSSPPWRRNARSGWTGPPESSPGITRGSSMSSSRRMESGPIASVSWFRTKPNAPSSSWLSKRMTVPPK